MWTEQLSNGNVKFVERYTDPLNLVLWQKIPTAPGNRRRLS